MLILAWVIGMQLCAGYYIRATAFEDERRVLRDFFVLTMIILAWPFVVGCWWAGDDRGGI